MSFDEDLRRVERDGKAADYKAILLAKTATKREAAFLQTKNDALRIAMLEAAAKQAMQKRVQKKIDWASKVQAFRRGERLPRRTMVKHLINSAAETKHEVQLKMERPTAGINPQENELTTLRAILDSLQSHVARQDRIIAELQLLRGQHLPNPITTTNTTTTEATTSTALVEQRAKTETNNGFVRRMDRIRATSAALQAQVADVTDSVFPDVTASMHRLAGAVAALEVKALACGYGAGLADEVRALKVALALHFQRLDGRRRSAV